MSLRKSSDFCTLSLQREATKLFDGDDCFTSSTSTLFFFKAMFYLFIWLYQISVVACRIFHLPWGTRIFFFFFFFKLRYGNSCAHLGSTYDMQIHEAFHILGGFPGGSVGKESPAMQETWVRSRVGKIPWRREWLTTSVFSPGEFHAMYSPQGHKQLDTTERLSLFLSWELLIEACGI